MARRRRRSPGRARLRRAPRAAAPMWQEAMRRRRYLRDRAEAAAGGGDGLQRSRDWLYESYYRMSQQHRSSSSCCSSSRRLPALLAVFFALRLVSVLLRAPPGPREAREGTRSVGLQPRGLPLGPGGSRPSRPARGRPGSSEPCGQEKSFPLGGSHPKIKLPGVWTRWTAAACVLHSLCARHKLAALSAHPLQRVSSESAPRLFLARPLPGSRDGILVWIGLFT